MGAITGLILLLNAMWYFTESFVKTCIDLFVPSSLRRRKNVAGEIVLVTGGGNGLGRQLAVGFAKLGAMVVIWDINQHWNEETARMIRKLGGVVHAYTVDVSEPDAVYAAAERVRREVGDVTILVNNAGIAHYRPALECPDVLIQKIHSVNALSHFWILKAFLPAMKAKNSGHIVTIGSMIAYMPMQFMGVYSSSKCTVHGIHESLQVDLTFENSRIKMTLACPVGMSTNMIMGRINHGSDDVTISPDEAAKVIIEGVLLEQQVVPVPRLHCGMFTVLKSFIPVKLLVKLLQVSIRGEVFLEDNKTAADAGDDRSRDGDDEDDD